MSAKTKAEQKQVEHAKLYVWLKYELEKLSLVFKQFRLLMLLVVCVCNQCGENNILINSFLSCYYLL